MSEPTRIRVSAERPYDVLVGNDLLGELPALLGPEVQRVAVVHPPTLIGLADSVLTRLTDAGYTVVRIPLPDAESAKTAAVAATCWLVLGQVGFMLSYAVVGVCGC